MVCVFKLATCLCNRPFFVSVGMTRSFGKRPGVRGLFFVVCLCLNIIMLNILAMATCLCIQHFLYI